jgi:hypothetical protein
MNTMFLNLLGISLKVLPQLTQKPEPKIPPRKSSKPPK